MIRFEVFVDRNESIEVLDLTQRAKNCVKRLGVMTLGDLIDDWTALPHTKGCGKGTIKEIRSALFNYNIEQMTTDQLANYRIEMV